MLESLLWESAAIAELEGRHQESVELAEPLIELGYQVGWELEPVPHIWLRQVATNRVMRWGTAAG
jgi:hypothetical protein